MAHGEFDYVIVGAGSAGCVLASRLTEDPNVMVCLLEAGGWDTSVLIHAPAGYVAMVPTKFNNYAYQTVPQPGLNGRRGYQPRGKTLGGSSSINAMFYVRGNGGITTTGRRSAITAGLMRTCCLCSSALKTTNSSKMAFTARAAPKRHLSATREPIDETVSRGRGPASDSSKSRLQRSRARGRFRVPGHPKERRTLQCSQSVHQPEPVA